MELKKLLWQVAVNFVELLIAGFSAYFTNVALMKTISLAFVVIGLVALSVILATDDVILRHNSKTRIDESQRPIVNNYNNYNGPTTINQIRK